MRTKAIINGFKNSQKFRFILKAKSGEEIGMVMSIQQMSDMFATSDARTAVYDALGRLSVDRQLAKMLNKPLPIGLATSDPKFSQVQVDMY